MKVRLPGRCGVFSPRRPREARSAAELGRRCPGVRLTTIDRSPAPGQAFPGNVRRRPKLPGVGRTFSERRVFPQGQNEVRSAAERAVHEQGWSIKPGATEWELRAAQNMSSMSWGERITISMGTAPGGGTQVIADSKLVFGFVDWGRNKSNVHDLFRSMETVLGPGHHESAQS